MATEKTSLTQGEDAFGAPNKFVITSSIFVAMNSLTLAYDVGITCCALLLMKDDLGLTTRQTSIFAASINFTAIFGACNFYNTLIHCRLF